MNDSVVRLHHWLSQSALPLWSTAGIDAHHGGFVERLALDGTPDFTVPKRVRVQARQLYVYSHAALLDLHPGASDAASHGFDFLLAHAWPDGIEAGVIHALSRNGQVVEDRRDSYDHAFVLFALSWYFRATRLPDVGRLLRPVAETVWRLLSHPGGEGVVIDSRGSTELHQNPHMHLFEALLAAYDATDDGYFLDRANALHRLFQQRMFDRVHGVIHEFHDADWRPVAGEDGDIVEPGHHCEWVWLLKRHADRAGIPLCEEAWRLYAFAERYGRAADDILLYDQVRADGTVRKASTRSWPQTEAIKADIAIAEARGTALPLRTERIIDALFARFIDPAIPGGWIDWLAPDGSPLVDMMPASTFYHLFVAFSEYLQAKATMA